jgi:hypothetical protein
VTLKSAFRWTGLLTCLIGCDVTQDVVIVVELPDLESREIPISGLPIIILPYDRDSFLAVLESSSERPRPHVRALDSLFLAFQAPYEKFARAAGLVRRYRDSLAHFKAELDTLPRDAEEYRRRFQQFAQLSDSLERAERLREAAATELGQARLSFVPLTDSLRREVRVWEEATFAGYDIMVKDLVDDTGRLGVSDTTGVRGQVSLTLGRGPWWVYARAWDILDPNSEWYWNVPITSDTINLHSSNGTRQATY